jgi:hypothetical protein
VNNESPWRAGVRLIPFGIAVPVGAGLVAAICGKRRLPPIYMLLLASVLQILGLVFMSRLRLGHILWNGQYGLQFMTGLGCGLSVGVVTLMTPFVIEKQDLGEPVVPILASITLMSSSNIHFGSCADSYAGRCAGPCHDYSGHEQQPQGHAVSSCDHVTDVSHLQHNKRDHSSTGTDANHRQRYVHGRLQYAAPDPGRFCSGGDTGDTVDVAEGPGEDCVNRTTAVRSC